MKKRFLILISLMMVLAIASPALAGYCYVKTPNGKSVNLRSTTDNSVIAQITYGTRMWFDNSTLNSTSALVSFNDQMGYVNCAYLTLDKPDPYVKPTPVPAATTYSGEIIGVGEGEFSITATGAVLQFANKKGKGAGTKYNMISFNDPVDVVVTAVVPKGRKISGWRINGVLVRFYKTLKTFRLPEVSSDTTIEVVFK